MVAQLVLKLCEGAVDAVGGVGDLEGWKTQAGEQARQVAFEAQKGAAQTRVRVAAAAGAGGGGAFVEEGIPFGVPALKGEGERRFLEVREPLGQTPKLACGGQFWFAGEQAAHGGDLVELAELDRT